MFPPKFINPQNFAEAHLSHLACPFQFLPTLVLHASKILSLRFSKNFKQAVPVSEEKLQERSRRWGRFSSSPNFLAGKCRAAGKSGENFPARRNFAGKPSSSNLLLREKFKGQQLKGKFVSENFSHFLSHFFPYKNKGFLAQGEQKRRKYYKKSRTNRGCSLVVARLSSS